MDSTKTKSADSGTGRNSSQSKAMPRRPVCPKNALYAARKQAWIVCHPAATAEEFERAMHQIAMECGV